MKFWLGVTDTKWYSFLSLKKREDINFWQPGGNLNFRALPTGGPFLFKLKKPYNAIAGIGFLSSHTFLPLSMAWDVFGDGNGCDSLEDLRNMIIPLRENKLDPNPIIGCVVLTNPIFFKEEDWVETPEDFKSNTVRGKLYSTEDEIGKKTWNKIEILLQKYLNPLPLEKDNQLTVEEPVSQYGKSVLVRVRLGQSAFRVLVTDAYNRKCAISGEKTLPVLEAAHIKPYAKSGTHVISNALLLRSDIHKLFDIGYLTITSERKVEVSKRIKEEFENGKEYYKFHGTEILNLPVKSNNKPDSALIKWHNENIYKG
jgi:putative restriction endonuclease